MTSFSVSQTDLDRLEKWGEAIQNPAVTNLTLQDLYMKKKVCHLHFEACYFSPSAKRLFWNAILSLYLPPPSAVLNLDNAATSWAIVNEREKVKNIHVDFEFRNNDLTAAEDNSTIAENTVSKFGKTTPARILKNMGFLHKDMSSKERKLYGVVKSLLKQLNRSNKSKESFKRRLFKARMFCNVQNKFDLNPFLSTHFKY